MSIILNSPVFSDKFNHTAETFLVNKRSMSVTRIKEYLYDFHS